MLLASCHVSKLHAHALCCSFLALGLCSCSAATGKSKFSPKQLICLVLGMDSSCLDKILLAIAVQVMNMHETAHMNGVSRQMSGSGSLLS